MDPSLKTVTAPVVTALDTAAHEPMFTEAFIHSLIQSDPFSLSRACSVSGSGNTAGSRAGSQSVGTGAHPVWGPTDNSTDEWEKPLWSQAHNLTTSGDVCAGDSGARDQ